jgi:hypothetical protein
MPCIQVTLLQADTHRQNSFRRQSFSLGPVLGYARLVPFMDRMRIGNISLAWGFVAQKRTCNNFKRQPKAKSGDERTKQHCRFV